MSKFCHQILKYKLRSSFPFTNLLQSTHNPCSVFNSIKCYRCPHPVQKIDKYGIVEFTMGVELATISTELGEVASVEEIESLLIGGEIVTLEQVEQLQEFLVQVPPGTDPGIDRMWAITEDLIPGMLSREAAQDYANAKGIWAIDVKREALCRRTTALIRQNTPDSEHQGKHLMHHFAYKGRRNREVEPGG